MKCFYLSFADPNRPKGQQWLGGMYIEAADIRQALASSRTCGNPGGEVMFLEVDVTNIKPGYLARLLTEDELRQSSIDDDTALVNNNGEEI